MMDNPFSDNDS